MFLHLKVPEPQQLDGFLYRQLLIGLKPIGIGIPFIYPLLAFILLYLQAVYFNKLVNDQRILHRPNYLTAMSYLLITSFFTDWNVLSAPLIINSLLIWVWSKMSGLYNNHKPKATLFNIGLIIGVCTFFYFPSIAFTLLIIFGLAITRPFKLAEWLIALLGILTPYYFLLVFVFLADKWQGYKFPGFTFSRPLFYQSQWAYAAIFIVLISAIVGIIYIQKNFMRQLIQARKSWNLTFLYLMVAIFVPFVNATHSFEYWILCAVPLAAFIAATFLYPVKSAFPLVLHWLMVFFIIVISYFT